MTLAMDYLGLDALLARSRFGSSSTTSLAI